MNNIFRFLLIPTILCLVQVGTFAQYDGKHELRAVWIATVDNMDWPTSRNLTTEQQKEELINYLDLFKSLNFNSIIFQVRPTADAFYASKLEPWSLYLTGQQGKAPDPFYDPLAFIIEEAHKRGMELHAWLNPYRLTQNVANLDNMDPNHIYKKHPEWFTPHGRKAFFDPALPQTRDFLCNVVADILRRYDVDGIHMDDYFYPNNDFEDSLSFVQHNRGFAPEEKMAWRRDNVDLVIRQLQDTVKSIKPYVKFGISPYAVWRNLRDDPRGSDTQSYGYTNYDHLHADVLKWMENKWVDYMMPQFYFHIGHPRADFAILAKWWADYSGGMPIYAGLGTFKLSANSNDPEWRSPEEVVKQIEHIRQLPEYPGVCYFNARNFTQNRLGITDVLKGVYTHPALIPALPGFTTEAPGAPQKVNSKVLGNRVEISWEAPTASDGKLPALYYAVYRFNKGATPDFTKGAAMVWLGGETKCALDVDRSGAYDYYVSAMDRLFNEGKAVKVTP